LPAALTFLFCLCTLSVPAQQTNGGTPANAYQVGERLTYSVTFSSFAPAAHVELYVAGRGVYYDRTGVELRGRVATVGAVSAALYAINHEYVTYLDPQTGLPYRTLLTKRAPDAPGEITSGSFATDAEVINAGTTTEDTTPATYDLLSAFYHLRALPLASGSTFPISAQNGGTQYNAELRVTGRETVKTPAGSFNALAAQLRVNGNARANDYRIRVYFTDDARHLPVLVTARLKAGDVRAELASVEVLPPEQPAPGAIAVAPTPTLTATPTPTPSVRPTPRTQPTPAGNAAAANADDQLKGLPFKVGEQLNFNFYLGTAAQPVGVASFVVRQRGRFFNREGILLSAALSTTQAGASLFPVNDQINSYVDVASLTPFRTELRVQEGRHRSTGVVSIDQERGTAIMADGKSVDVPVGTYDWVAVLYALRSFDLTPPKRNAVSLLINRRPRALFITSLRRETIELGGQRIPAVQLALATDDPQGDRMNLRLWVSLDRRRLPLRLTATTPLGLVRADLAIIPLTEQ
jgi:hypothetical protein